MRKILAVASKELRQIVRDRRSLLVLLVVPAYFLLLYGYALSFDVKHIQLAVYDQDRSKASLELIDTFLNSGYFDLRAEVSSNREYEELIDRGDVRVVLVIPSGLQEDLLSHHRTPVQLIINGDNANTASTVMGYALRAVQAASAPYQVQGSARPGAGIVTIESRVWYNPELRSALFLIPGLIAYIGMISSVISTSLSVVREKERGTMEQIRMAPLRTGEYIIGKTLPYFAISLVSSVFIVLASMALFDLPMRGSWAVLLLALALYLAGALGLGLMVSTIAESQQVAFQIAVLSSFLPTLILSGFVFPIASMPPFIQAVTYIVPARYFIVALRAIVLKGAPIPAFWMQLVALAVYATAMLTLASRRLHKQWG